MMGPEEVLIQGQNVSVNGQLIPDGESRLLHGKGAVGSRTLPRTPFVPLGQSSYPSGQGTAKGAVGWEPAALSPLPLGGIWKSGRLLRGHGLVSHLTPTSHPTHPLTVRLRANTSA